MRMCGPWSPKTPTFWPSDETAWLEEGEVYEDLLTGEKLTARAVAMKPYEFRWLILRYPQEKE